MLKEMEIKLHSRGGYTLRMIDVTIECYIAMYTRIGVCVCVCVGGGRDDFSLWWKTSFQLGGQFIVYFQWLPIVFLECSLNIYILVTKTRFSNHSTNKSYFSPNCDLQFQKFVIVVHRGYKWSGDCLETSSITTLLRICEKNVLTM